MAKIIKGKNYLKKDIYRLNVEIKKHNINIFKYVGLGLLSMFSPYLFVCTMIYLCMIELRDRKMLSKEYEIKNSGYKGENKTLEILSKLPDTYTVITDLEVTVDEKTSQIDTVIISPFAIFCCEVKNTNGTITGDANDINLLQHKFSKKGGQYTKEVYNPIKQVSTHVFRLSSILKQRGHNLWIQGVVFFANDNTEVLVNNVSNIPIFSAKDGEGELLEYFLSVGSNQPQLKDRDKIIEILLKHIHN